METTKDGDSGVSSKGLYKRVAFIAQTGLQTTGENIKETIKAATVLDRQLLGK
jgi:hypothetical protein